jgi:hypothetical protein
MQKSRRETRLDFSRSPGGGPLAGCNRRRERFPKISIVRTASYYET